MAKKKEAALPVFDEAASAKKSAGGAPSKKELKAAEKAAAAKKKASTAQAKKELKAAKAAAAAKKREKTVKVRVEKTRPPSYQSETRAAIAVSLATVAAGLAICAYFFFGPDAAKMNLVEKIVVSTLSLGIPLVICGLVGLVAAPMDIRAKAREQGLLE